MTAAPAAPHIRAIPPSYAAAAAPDMQKLLIFLGAAILVIGLLWPWLSNLGLGRLPGDIVVQRDNLTLYFPITTMILISIILTLLFRLIGK